MTTEQEIHRELDASGLECPMPLLRTKLALRDLSAGEVLRVIATDPGSARDIPRYIEMSPHQLLGAEDVESRYCFLIRKGE